MSAEPISFPVLSVISCLRLPRENNLGDAGDNGRINAATDDGEDDEQQYGWF